jgi:hypothetical protein
VHPGPHRALDRVPRALQVGGLGAGQAADDGDVAVGVDGAADVERDGFDGLEIVGGGDGEAGLDDVDTELGQLNGGGERGARGVRWGGRPPVFFCGADDGSAGGGRPPTFAPLAPSSSLSLLPFSLSLTCFAMSSFSLLVSVAPGDCSPSRSVVSKMRT